MICGIKNYKKEFNSDSDYYIYDSNNIYSTDDWSKLLKKDTIDMVFEEFEYNKKIKFKKWFTSPTLFTPMFFIYTYKKNTIPVINQI